MRECAAVGGSGEHRAKETQLGPALKWRKQDLIALRASTERGLLGRWALGCALYSSLSVLTPHDSLVREGQIMSASLFYD